MADSNSILKQITVNGATINLVKSANVKVFPCAYRGYYQKAAGDDTITVKVFDPEARGFTEYNFSNTFGKLGTRKQSYVVDWQVSVNRGNEYSSILKCVVGGYYFELYDVKPEDFVNAEGKMRYLAIKTKDVSLANEPFDTERKTKILDAFVDSTNYLDVLNDSVYVFAGLALIDDGTSISTSYQLFPFIKNNDGTISISNAEFGISEALDSGEGLYSVRRLGDQRSDNDKLFDGIATGNYSAALGRGSIASGEGATTFGLDTEAVGENALAAGKGALALGKNSIAFGEGTVATRKNSIVLGQFNEYYKDPSAPGYVEASDKNILIIGNGADGNRKNILELDETGKLSTKAAINAVGLIQITGITSTVKENKLVLGDGVTDNFGKLWIYGSGATLVFDADQSGNLKLAGNLDVAGAATIRNTLQVNGTITANGKENNTLTLGSSVTGEYGAIDIYGTDNNKIFTVAKDGKTYIANDLDVDGSADIGVDLKVGGDTELNKTLKVTGSSTLSGDVAINESLTVTKGISTTDSTDGTLTIAGATTLQKGLTVTSGNIVATASDITAKQLIIKNGDAVVAQINNSGEIKAKNKLTVNVTQTTTSSDIPVFNVDSSGNVIAAGNVAAASYSFGVGDNAITLTKNTTTGNIDLNNALFVNGKLTQSDTWALVSSNAPTTAFASITKTLATLPALSVAGTAEILGNTELKSTVTVSGAATFNQTVDISDDTNIQGDLTLAGGINAGGEISAPTYNATSDLRRKTNIEDFSYSKSILDLPIKTFEFKDDASHRKHIGCIAQDLAQLYPELVHTDTDGYLTIEEGKLVYLLLEEVRLLRKEITALKGE